MENKSIKWKLLFLTLLFPFFSFAQSYCPLCVDTFRIDNNDDITTVTGCIRCITPAVLGPELDSLAKYIILLRSSIGSAVGFQGVLNAGNVASDASSGTNSFALQNSTTTTNLVANPDLLALRIGGTNLLRIYGGGGGAPSGIAYYDYSTGNYSAVQAGALTGIRTVTLPNEGGILVTHTTATPIYIGTSSTGTELNNSFININTSGTVWSQLGAGYLGLKDGASAYYSNVFPTALTGSRIVLLPDEGSGVGVASTLVTHTTKDAITVGTSTVISKVNAGTVGVFRGGTPSIYLADVINYGELFLLDGSGSGFYGTLATNTLTANRILTLPDKAGTLATLADVVASSYPPSGSTGDFQLKASTTAFTSTTDWNYNAGVTTVKSSGSLMMSILNSGVTLENKINVTTGANKALNTATLVNGTVTVNNTSVTASSRIYVQYASGSALILGIGNVSTTLYVPTITAGVSFVINAVVGAGVVNPTDNSVVQYWIIN